MVNDQQELLIFVQPVPGKPLHCKHLFQFHHDLPNRDAGQTHKRDRRRQEHEHSYFGGKAVMQVG